MGKKERAAVSLQFRFNSIFFRTFLLVLLVCGLLIGSFLLYVVASENRNLKSSTEESLRNLLRTDSIATEMTLTNLQQMMNQTIWEKEFTSAMVTPNRDSYTRTSAIITRLHQIAQDYAYIHKAFLYIPTNETVYSSDQSYLPVEETSYELFRDTEYLKRIDGTKLTQTNDSLFVKNASGKVYLCQHLYPDYIRSIGMLIFEIDPSRVKANSDAERYTIYDRDGSRIFAQEEAALEDISQWMSAVNGQAEGTVAAADNESYYYYRSSLTGWVYLLPERTGSRVISGQKILWLVTGAVLLGLFFAFLASSRISRPVRKLVDEVAGKNPGMMDAKNEMEYLTRVYRTQDEQNRELQQTLETVTPLALEHLFSRVLSGHAPSSEEIAATLESLGNPFPEQARYMVIRMELTDAAGGRLSAPDYQICAMNLQKNLPAALPEDSWIIPVYREEGILALVLVVPPAQSEAQTQQTVGVICRTAGEDIPKPYHMTYGCGNIYDRPCDAQYSYRDAGRSLARRKFYAQEAADPGPDEQPVRNSYFELCRDLIRTLQSGGLREAQLRNDRILSGILAAEDAAGETEKYLITLLQVAGIMQAADIRDLEAERSVFCAGLAQKSGREIREFCSGFLEKLEQRYSRKASQHIERIQEYLQENYSDSSLSLDMAAEQAGISSSYLSRLFRQSLNVSFVDYLNGLRVAAAQELLVSSDRKVKDIAYMTGFNSTQSFFRIFKKFTGMSPGDYRQRSGGER